MCKLQEKDNPEFSDTQCWYRSAPPAAWRQFFDIRYLLNASLSRWRHKAMLVGRQLEPSGFMTSAHYDP